MSGQIGTGRQFPAPYSSRLSGYLEVFPKQQQQQQQDRQEGMNTRKGAKGLSHELVWGVGFRDPILALQPHLPNALHSYLEPCYQEEV